MKANLFFQNDKENSMYGKIEEEFINNPKKVYILLGKLKEDGYGFLEEQLIDCKSKIYVVLGIDKKNTTKSILEGLLNYTNDIYVYNNNNIKEFESNVFVFEYSSYANIYLSTSSFSKNGITDSIALYTKSEYDLKNKEEKNEYSNIINELLSKFITKEENDEKLEFKKLDKDMIEKLINDKEIFSTRQYIHNIKSISELLEKSKDKKEESTDDLVKEENIIRNIEIPKIDIDDDNFDISIDFSDIDDNTTINIEELKNNTQDDIKKDIEINDIKSDEELSNKLYNENFENDEDTNLDEFNDKIDKNNELYDEELEDVNFDENETLDINELLFSKADAKLNLDDDTKLDKKNKLDNNGKFDNKFSNNEEVVKVKKLNLNNVSNYIFELPSKPKSGAAVESIRIPNYIKKMIPEFFEMENVPNTIEDGVIYKKRNIVLEIVNVKDNLKYNDNKAKLIYKNGQTYISFDSSIIRNIEYDEYDIARIIKLSSEIYHIEIISKDIQEYKIWKKLCTQKLKSVDRKYGMM